MICTHFWRKENHSPSQRPTGTLPGSAEGHLFIVSTPHLRQSKLRRRKSHELEAMCTSFPIFNKEIRASSSVVKRKGPEPGTKRLSTRNDWALCAIKITPPESWLIFDSLLKGNLGNQPVQTPHLGKQRLREGGFPEGHSCPWPSQTFQWGSSWGTSTLGIT